MNWKAQTVQGSDNSSWNSRGFTRRDLARCLPRSGAGHSLLLVRLLRSKYCRPVDANYGWTHPAVFIVGVSNQNAISPNSDRKSTRLNSSHVAISYAVFCLKKKNKKTRRHTSQT